MSRSAESVIAWLQPLAAVQTGAVTVSGPASRCSALYFTALQGRYGTSTHCTAMYCTSQHCTAFLLHHNAMFFNKLQCSSPFCNVHKLTAMYFTKMNCRAPYFTALHCTVLYCNLHANNCTLLHCTAKHCTVLHHTVINIVPPLRAVVCTNISLSSILCPLLQVLLPINFRSTVLQPI